MISLNALHIKLADSPAHRSAIAHQIAHSAFVGCPMALFTRVSTNMVKWRSGLRGAYQQLRRQSSMTRGLEKREIPPHASQSESEGVTHGNSFKFITKDVSQLSSRRMFHCQASTRGERGREAIHGAARYTTSRCPSCQPRHQSKKYCPHTYWKGKPREDRCQ